MTQPEKTVFISYRRTNIGYALAVYQNLTSKGYDCFFDYNSIDSGDFEQIILNNIASRAHFVVLLTPSALERLSESGDWLRREMEYAIEMKRNIIPLTMENFDWKKASEYLTGGLEPIKNYNALRVPAEYFMEAMERLSSRHLNVGLDGVIHPRSAIAQQAAEKAQEEAEAQPQVTEKAIENELTAEEYFDKAYEQVENSKYELGIENYTKAIELMPDYADAYNNRGIAHKAQGDLDTAIQDFTQAIQLKPDFAFAYNNRGIARSTQGDLDGAIQDYSEVINLTPNDFNAYNGRAWVFYKQKIYTEALVDISKALDLNTKDANSLHTRGAIYLALNNVNLAIDDFELALGINPHHKASLEDLAKAKAMLKEN